MTEKNIQIDRRLKMDNNYTTIQIGNTLKWDTPIMRYTSLHSLEQMLNLHFFVKERNQYDQMDAHEKGVYTNKGYGFTFELVECLNKNQKQEKKKRSLLQMENIEKSYSTLVSCWTLSQIEKEKMWVNKEVLIKTTIGKFISSLDLNSISSIICDEVKYSTSEQIKLTLQDFLFLKEGTCFAYEEELRFYIYSDMRNGIDIKGKENNKSALLPLNGYTFIDTIVFNPLLSENQVVLKNNLLANYPQITKLIKESNI